LKPLSVGQFEFLEESGGSVFFGDRDLDDLASTTKLLLTNCGMSFRNFWLYILIMKLFQRFLKDEQGQDLIEYTLLMAFIALASAAVFVSTGGSVKSIWGAASNTLSNAAVSAS
jgi:Flp pilus assembly pilin Flp